MPRFAPDPNDARVTTRIFPRGEYELTVNNVVPFIREKADGSGISAGALIFSKMVGKIDSMGNVVPEFEGEDVSPLRCYVHTDGAWRMTKGYLMAILGFARDEEDKFNETYNAESFVIDGEVGDREGIVLGSGWNELEGLRFHATLVEDVYTDDSGHERASQEYASVFGV